MVKLPELSKIGRALFLLSKGKTCRIIFCPIIYKVGVWNMIRKFGLVL
jgi:hypothetical protein